MGNDEGRWIRKAKKGSRKAFEKLVRKHIAFVYHLLVSFAGNEEDAQDLTQEVFLKAFINIRRFRGDCKFSTWLYRIAYNLSVDFNRKRKRISRLDSAIQKRVELDKQMDVTLMEGDIYLREAVHNALYKLSRSQRLTVLLYHYKGLKMEEISKVLGCSEGTVRVHLFRALRQLRKELGDYLQGE